MEEKWAKIPGFPNYEISNTGKIERVGKTKRTPVKVCRSVNYLYASIAYAPRKYKQINVKTTMDQCFTEHVYTDHSNDDLPGEIWKDVVDWEGSYEVSNLGRVRSKLRFVNGKNGCKVPRQPKIKESYLDEDGYPRISLYDGSRSKLMGVHRIVAQAFVPNPENKPEVNHINGDKEDNCAENLEWVTNLENIRHSIETGLRDPNTSSISVLRLEDNKHFKSIAELHREIGGNYREIAHLLRVSDKPACINGQHYTKIG